MPTAALARIIAFLDGERRAFTRGGLLKVGGAALVAAGVPAAAHAAQARKDPLFYLRQATYVPHLNSTFRLEHPHAPLKAELVEITNLMPKNRRGRKAGGGEVFSLLFETTKTEPVVQGTYTLHHSQIGTFSLFLVPVGRGVKGHYLEAIVNRLAS